MESKYYTPSIEEFHPGFEFQFNNGENWHNGMINSALEFLSLQKMLERQILRVKVLDKEDIESCGWYQVGKSIDDFFEINGSFDVGFNTFNIKLQYGYHDNRMRISTIDWQGGGSEYDLFRGIIKNKSELMKLMKQIGI